MYSLSRDTDLTFLIDTKIISVATSQFQAQLYLDNKVEISVEGECELDQKPVGFLQLESLAGAKIFGATVQVDGGINLFFEDGRRLTLLDSNDTYESYQITGPGVNIIV